MSTFKQVAVTWQGEQISPTSCQGAGMTNGLQRCLNVEVQGRRSGTMHAHEPAPTPPLEKTDENRKNVWESGGIIVGNLPTLD